MKKSIFLVLIFCTLACRKSKPEFFALAESSTYPYSRFEQDYYYWESIPSNKKPPLPKVHLVGLKDKNNQSATGEYEINYRLISPYQETNWHQEKRELKDGTLILAIDIHAFLDREKLWAFGGTQRLLFEFVVQNKQGKIEQIHIPLFIDTYRANPDPYLLIKSLTKYEQNPDVLGIEIACAKFNHFSNDNTPEIQVQFNSQETFTTVKFEVDEQKNTCFLNVNIPKNVPFDENLRILLWQDFRPKNKIVTLVNTWMGNKHRILSNPYCLNIDQLLKSTLPFSRFNKVVKNEKGELIHLENTDSALAGGNSLLGLSTEQISAISPEGYNLWQCFSELQKIVMHELQIQKIPETLSVLQKLKHIEISWTKLNEFPKFWLTLPLIEFHLLSSNFSEFPKELTTITSLKKLILNSIGNEKINIPNEMKQLLNLEVLDLADNQIIDFSPFFFESTFQKLTTLNLQGTYINYSNCQCSNEAWNILYAQWRETMKKIKEVYQILVWSSKY